MVRRKRITGAQSRKSWASGECRFYIFFFQAEDGIRDLTVTGVQTCALPISRFVPMGSSRSRDMFSCLWRIAIWPVTRSPERRQARMFIHVTCFKATSYVTHFKSALSFGEGHASRGILRNHGRNNNSPATPRRNAYTTESSETRVPDTDRKSTR